MKKLISHPLFLVGFCIRIFLIIFSKPAPILLWYVPFITSSINNFTFDPWTYWTLHNGSISSFPYGYLMWLWFLPTALLCKITGINLIYGFYTSLLIADFLLMFLLQKIFDLSYKFLIQTYWMSPILLLSIYLFGYNDLIPIFILYLSIFYLKNLKLFISGFLLIAAISSKLSMIVAIPFFLIYLQHNRILHVISKKFIQGLLFGTIFLLCPFFLFSVSGRNMVLNNQEIVKIYEASIDFGPNWNIYSLPLIYCMIVYIIWCVHRLNFDLFHTTLGISFFAIVLMSASSPGWFVWIVPLFVTWQSKKSRYSVLLISLFSLLFIVANFQIIIENFNFLKPFYVAFKSIAKFYTLRKVFDLTATLLVATGIIIITKMWRETVNRNDYFRLMKKPFTLGISGDSGAGKDTFAGSIIKLFGTHTVTSLSGDDYHLWDRQKPMWNFVTHLNPIANDLERFGKDLISLIDGKDIRIRHYNHKTGQMSQPIQIKSNDIIVASGLHALYLPIFRECYDLSIYLDIDENLRRYFKLDRDINQRGHTKEKVLSTFEKREPDSKRFIRPQKNYADLILSLQPVSSHIISHSEKNHSLKFKLLIRSRIGLDELILRRVLISICQLNVDITTDLSMSETQMIIEGETDAQDIAIAAKIICPKIFEFLDIHPKWENGMLGIMQLITLSYINHALMKRVI